MRRTLQLITLSLGALFTLSATPPASAQDTPKVDIFGGYSYVHANIVVSGTSINLNGGSGSLAYNFNDWLGVVGDVGFYHQGSITANDLSLTVSTYQVGPRVSLRRHHHLIPFGQVLVGAGHAGGTLYTSSLGAGLAPLGTSNGFVLTAGGGVDWKLNHTIGIRLLQAEYLYSRFDNGATHGNQQNNLRLSAGIVLSFGKH
jgi:Outer membrane protein beta-barrel domain